MAKEARKEEMKEFRKHKVYIKVPIEECYQVTGKGPLGIRWIDINKGDDVNPEYRSRLVAQEVKRDSSLELFAATPPLEALRTLSHRAATARRGQRKSTKKTRANEGNLRRGIRKDGSKLQTKAERSRSGSKI